MKTITLFLFVLILATACSAPEPAAEPILMTRNNDATAVPTSPANTPAPEASPTADSPALIPQTFLWVIESGERLGDFYLVKRSADEGLKLWRTPLDAAPYTAVVHPYDGSVWVGVEGALIKLSSKGEVQTIIPIVQQPEFLIIATVLAPITAVDETVPPVPTAPDQPNPPFPTPTIWETPTPRPVTPTPISANPSTAEICAIVAEMLPEDCAALVEFLHEIDPTLQQTLVNEGCGGERFGCDEDGRLIHLDLSYYHLNSLPPEN